jgi:Flp pilus assembly protein TadG
MRLSKPLNGARPLARRPGTAAVEFAVIAPILMTLMLGMVEVTRGIQVKQLLTDTARSGARLGAQPGMATSDIQSNVNAILTNNGITAADATTTVSVNGSSSNDAKNAIRGDKISVQISIPISKVNWVSPLFFPTTAVTSESLHMVRQ